MTSAVMDPISRAASIASRMDRAHANGSRYRPESVAGHYESWFVRGNHPSRPLAFWIRHTIFAPRGRPHDAVGERWAIVFDGEVDRITAVRERVPMAECSFAADGLDARVGESVLDDTGLRGQASGDAVTMAWDLRMHGGGDPMLLLPDRMYEGSFPAAKAVVSRPLVRFAGTIDDGVQTIDVDDWLGSQNHNWGRKHTDRYAWGQVAGFDGADDVLLECSTVQLRLGPFTTPRLGVAVLRVGDETYAFTGALRALRARTRIHGLDWSLATRNADATLQVRVHAPAQRFVGLTYDDPPGGSRLCLNCKLAACELELARPGRPTLSLRTQHRAAFELVGHDVAGIPLAVC
jgi:hypothetical protein